MGKQHNRSQRAHGQSARARRPPSRQGRSGHDRRRTPAARRRSVVNRAVIAVGSAIVLGVVMFAIASHASTAGYDTGTSTFKLPRLDASGNVSLASLHGHPVVVNFFASWCTQCAAELPVFARDARTMRGKVDFIEVNTMETGDGLGFARRFGLPGSVTAVARDVGGVNGNGLYTAFGGNGSLPLTAFYGADGSLVTTHLGGYDASSLAAELHQLYRVNTA